MKYLVERCARHGLDHEPGEAEGGSCEAIAASSIGRGQRNSRAASGGPGHLVHPD